MIHAKFHGLVNVLPRCDSRVEHLDSFVDVGHQQSVRDEPGRVLRSDYRLAHLDRELPRRVKHQWVSLDCRNQLDQLHDWDGIDWQPRLQRLRKHGMTWKY